MGSNIYENEVNDRIKFMIENIKARENFIKEKNKNRVKKTIDKDASLLFNGIKLTGPNIKEKLISMGFLAVENPS